MDELEERLVKLETLVAFHEDTIGELTTVSQDQQRAIDALERKLKHAEDKLRAVSVSNQMDPADESPPPHY